MQSSSQGAYRLHLGDSVPNFNVIRNPGGAVVEDVLHTGKCYLINFWATWCGNCLLELLPTEIPQFAEKFIDDKDFVFLPICIDTSSDELESFFNSERGERWKHLKYVTTLDQDRTANSIFAEAGHLPLTVVVGKNGRIVYIHIGRISTKNEFDELEKAIVAGLAVNN
ncbi:MAG: TlpA family protein disulfide reductase [Bacteroides sp.]|nr:TlpA family protein disulfide reductase [Bacteroides sp.]